ncbi:alpha/beta hydrolase [Neisseria chenwenguii]|uniref:Serine hydrolase n=1 Tax=Neisseria chenwenguii TaxID=1853278 RepID=A0A220S120_9NEIS|nr:alpha/beta hydrolase [Neisseria chenwenguii]ASK27179.1 serine hydrolase [Neisseria chenwenguii]ROV54881.1 serine hydrolase [Neisseria chenwenguii]
MLTTRDLEDLTLLLVRDAAEPEMWIDRWALSYPVIETAEVSRGQRLEQWQTEIQTAFSRAGSGRVAAVAHGVGVFALLAWLYRADIQARARLCNVILVSPNPDALPDDAEHTFQKVRIPCRAALVVGESGGCPHDWAAEKAALWNARLLVSPHSGRLNGALGGWQWGMKLMQEMLLSR